MTTLISISLTIAPWLLIGLFASGLIKAFMPEQFLKKWLSGQGPTAVSRAAFIGAPLPLCSCGAIPAALTLYRKGAGKGPAISFLISTPGIGVDSVFITNALLGPLMTLARVTGAVVTAVSTGLLVALADQNIHAVEKMTFAQKCCCSEPSCRKTDNHTAPEQKKGLRERLSSGMKYVFYQVLNDIILWIALGTVIAAGIMTFFPPETLASHGSGIGVMLLMAVAGIPLYICATAVTPIGAALLATGVAPGAVLVLLLAGPVTSMATLGVIRREMGNTTLICYVAGIICSTMLLGIALELMVSQWVPDLSSVTAISRELLPKWLEWSSLAVLFFILLFQKISKVVLPL